MANQDIIQNMISRLGQSQADRVAPELDPAFAPVDGRDTASLLKQARELAAHINYYHHARGEPAGSWSNFFPAAEMDVAKDRAALQALVDGTDGATPPHLALLIAFLKLYRLPQDTLNDFTARHLDFQMRRVLGFAPRPPQPDRAHLILELKKGVAPLVVTPAHAFTAGKDAKKIELLYAPVRETVVGQGRVGQLCAVHRATDGLRFAPVANSADGLGAALDPALPMWSPFGSTVLPRAPIGFALASPVLRMKEGTREIKIDLQLANLTPEHHAEDIAASFEAWLSGPKGWLGPHSFTGSLAGGRLTLSFTVADSEPAIVDYRTDIHGHHFTAHGPVLQCLLKTDARLRDDALADLTPGRMGLRVHVEGIRSLALENDQGSLDSKKAFLPFGPLPGPGSRFLIGCEEALSKQVTDLSVKLHWMGAPSDLYAWYDNYARRSAMLNGVTATFSFQDRGGQTRTATLDLMARDELGISTLSPGAPPPSYSRVGKLGHIFVLRFAGGRVGRRLARGFRRASPVFDTPTVTAPPERDGFISVLLNDDFLHADYRKETLSHALNQDKIVLNEPYTPKVQAIRLSYRAQSDEVDVNADNLAAFGNLDVQFFHVGCFGQARRHAYLLARLPWSAERKITLLPRHPHAGEFLIGLAGVSPGEGLSLLLQAAEGSADPTLTPQTPAWSVLCDNHWKLLGPREFVLDTSNQLRRSGLIGVTLPHETTTEHTWMPTGLAWLRATVPADAGSVCKLLEVSANAIEVKLVSEGNDPAHLASALPAGKIAKMVAPVAALKSVRQPYASFAGAPAETTSHLAMRASERLRHRQRCIAPWDYERMLLEAFPSLHKVKCIPHASPDSWLTPGHVMLVAIPDLRNRNASNPLQPKVDMDTLTRMAEFARRHAPMGVKIWTRNPRYQSLRCSFKVRMHPGYPFIGYRPRINEALVQALSPWLFEADHPLDFGGKVYRSVLLNRVEDLPWVDYVTDFRLLSAGHGTADLAEVSADTPDAILVSAVEHAIDEVSDE